MDKIAAILNSPGWVGLISNLVAVWGLLALSLWTLSSTGNNLGEPTSPATRGAPWTPPGAFIGAVWAVLYTLMALTLWVLNQAPDVQIGPLKLSVYLLIGFCLVWPFYAFSETSRLPGLLGNIGIFLISAFVIWRVRPDSSTAALMIAPVTVWIAIATASILDGARRYGW